jgi:hypothetical protein
MEKTLAYWENKNSSNAGGGSISTGGNSAPVISAPQINNNTPNISTSNPKTVNYKIDFGGKSLELLGDPSHKI